jgi:hypothetical protein
MSTTAPPQYDSFGALRSFVRRRDMRERCDICRTGLAPGHQHLVEPSARRLICSCDACAVLFGSQGETKYRRVPSRVRALRDFRLSDAQWDELTIPIGMAFFLKSSMERKILACYPSPAGATESLPPPAAWDEIVEANPVLRDMDTDVEALLANRLNHTREGGGCEYYLVPIDKCYELVGLIRTHWRGLSGGTEVWKEIRSYFDLLRSRAVWESANA